MSHLTPAEHTGIGALAGITEVFLLQPTVGIKNALQEGRPVPRSLTKLYRGLAMNAGANFPITAVQFGTSSMLEQAYTRVTGQRPTMSGDVAVAMGAGAVSAYIACPSEVIVIHQQKSGRSLVAETGHLVRTYGPLKLLKGIYPTIVRDALYTASYMSLLPLVKSHLEEHTSLGEVPGAPLVAAGICAGVLGSASTHGFDTVKTRMQAFPDDKAYPQYRSMWSTAQHIVRTEGASHLFRGLLPRAFRNCGAVIILNSTLTTFVDLLDDRRLRLEHMEPAAA